MRNLIIVCLLITGSLDIFGRIAVQSDTETLVKRVLLHKGTEGEKYDIKSKLEEIGQHQQIVEILLKMVQDGKYAKLGSPQGMLIPAATFALGALKEPQAVAVLKENLNDEKVDDIVRALSARALSQIDLEGNKQILLDALQNKSNYYRIRLEAAEALANTKDPNVLKTLDKHSNEEKDTHVKKQLAASAEKLRTRIQSKR